METTDVTNPPPVQYERQLMDYKPTHGSLNAWTGWCQQHLKDLSVKVQGLENAQPREMVPIGQSYRSVPHANGRLEALESRLFGQPWGTQVPGATGGLEARFHEYQLIQNSRARKMNIKLMLQERRIAALEKNS